MTHQVLSQNHFQLDHINATPDQPYKKYLIIYPQNTIEIAVEGLPYAFSVYTQN